MTQINNPIQRRENSKVPHRCFSYHYTCAWLLSFDEPIHSLDYEFIFIRILSEHQQLSQACSHYIDQLLTKAIFTPGKQFYI